MALFQPKLSITINLDPAGVAKGSSTVKAELNGINKVAGQSRSRMDKLKSTISSMWRITGGILLFNMIRKITRAFEDLVKVGLDFEAQMANVESVVQDPAGLQKLTDAVVDLALDPRIKDGPAKLAEGLYTVTSAGYDSADSMNILKWSALGATAGISDTKTATDVLIGTLGAFGRGADQAEYTMNQLFQIVALSKYTFNDLASALSTVTPTAAALGVTFDEVGAAMATMGFKGIDANTATVNMNAILSGLLKPTTELQDAMESLGFTNGVTMIQTLGFTGTLKALYNLVGGNKQKLTDMFGNVRAQRGIFALTNDQGEEYNKMLTQMGYAQDKGGATTRALTEQMKSNAFQIAVLKKNVQILAVLGFGMLSPYLSKVLVVINTLFSGMIVSFRHFRDKGYGFFHALRAAAKTAFGDMFGPKAAMQAANFVDKLEEFFFQLKSVVKTVGPVVMEFLGFMYKHFDIIGPAILGVVVALKVYAATLLIVNAITAVWAALTSPMFLIVLAIMAVVVLFAVSYSKNWLGIRDITNSAVKGIVKAFKSLWSFVQPVVKAITTLGTYWKDIVTHKIEPGNLAKIPIWMVPIAIATGRIVKTLRVFFKTWQDKGFLSALKTIPAQIREFGRQVSNVFQVMGLPKFAAMLRLAFNDISHVFMDVVNLFDDLVHGRWGKIWGDLKSLAIDGFESIATQILLLPELILDINSYIPWGTIWDMFKTAGRTIVKAVWSGIKSLMKWLGKQTLIGLGQMYDQVIWYVKGFYDAGRILLSWIWTGIASLWTWIWGQMSNLPGWLITAVEWYANGFYDAGRDVVSGIWRGISSLGGWLWTQVSDFVSDNILGAITDKLHINSPSLAAAKITVAVPEGMAMGMMKGKHFVKDAADKLALMSIGGVANLRTGNGFRRGTLPTVNATSLNGGRPAGQGLFAAMAGSRSLVFKEGAIVVKDSGSPLKTARVLLAEIHRQESGMH